MRISDWSSDVCSSDLHATAGNRPAVRDHRLHPALALLEADHRLPPDLAAQAQEAAGQFLHEAEVVHRVPDIGIEHRPLEDRCEARLELPPFLRLQPPPPPPSPPLPVQLPSLAVEAAPSLVDADPPPQRKGAVR